MTSFVSAATQTQTKSPFERMYEKIEQMSDASLQTVWDSLARYDPSDFYDHEGQIKMDDWAMAIYSEMSLRGLALFA